MQMGIWKLYQQFCNFGNQRSWVMPPFHLILMLRIFLALYSCKVFSFLFTREEDKGWKAAVCPALWSQMGEVKDIH